MILFMVHLLYDNSLVILDIYPLTRLANAAALKVVEGSVSD
jgi:hypothetical protein